MAGAPRIAIFQGTFDPVHNGHLFVISRAAELFDEVVALISVNPDKSEHDRLFTVEERLALLRECTSSYPNVRCDSTTDPRTTNYADACGAKYMVRGMRDAADAEFELKLAKLLATVAPQVVTVVIPVAVTSSTEIKALAERGEDLAPYCPEPVARRLAERLRERAQPSAGASQKIASGQGRAS